jgi:hypothetical protein
VLRLENLVRTFDVANIKCGEWVGIAKTFTGLKQAAHPPHFGNFRIRELFWVIQTPLPGIRKWTSSCENAKKTRNG